MEEIATVGGGLIGGRYGHHRRGMAIGRLGYHAYRMLSGRQSLRDTIKAAQRSSNFQFPQYYQTDSMAPITPSSSRNVVALRTPRSRSRGRTSKRRRVSVISSSSSSRGTSLVPYGGPRGRVIRAGRSNENAQGLRAAKVKNRVNKRVTIKKPKKVKVSKNFKIKVENALKPKTNSGYYLEVGHNAYTFPITNGNKQYSERLGNSSNFILCFNPSTVLDAASVLFNGKVASQTKESIAAGIYTFGTGSFDARTVKIPVHNSYAAYVLRNNSPRTWIINLYEASPKMSMDITDEGDCYTQWLNCMLNEANNPGANPAQFAINVGGATPETLYASPQRNKMLAGKWSFERHDIILDPGQSYDHFMQGPANVVYDYAKFWKQDSAGSADRFYDLQKKFTRQLFFVARLDIVQDSTYVAARYGSPQTGGGLVVEWKNYFNIGAPEQTAGSVVVPGAATVAFNLNQRRDPYFHKTWTTYSSTTPTIRTELQTGTDNV